MNRWIRSLIIADLSLIVAVNLFAPIYAIFAEQIGGDILAVGESWGIYAVTTGIFIIILGKIEERKSKLKMLMISYGLFAIGFSFYLVISNLYGLILVQILLGIALAVNIPAWDTLYTLHIDKGKESTEWGAYAGLSYITSGISAAIGAVLVSVYSFKALFLVMILLSLIGLFYLVYITSKLKKL